MICTICGAKDKHVAASCPMRPRPRGHPDQHPCRGCSPLRLGEAGASMTWDELIMIVACVSGITMCLYGLVTGIGRVAGLW